MNRTFLIRVSFYFLISISIFGLAADEGKAPFMVKKAMYGANETWLDVTQKVKSAGDKDDTLSINVSNDQFGDPLQGVQKVLKVIVVYKGKDIELTADEWQELVINAGILEKELKNEGKKLKDRDLAVQLKLGETWKVFLNAEDPESYGTIPESLKVFGGRDGDVMPKTARMNGDTIDLSALAGMLEVGTPAVVYNEFTSSQAGKAKLGFSADWWMEVYINGRQILSTMKEGNGSVGNYKPSDHVVSFQVKEGKNLVAAKIKSGSAGWCFVCGLPPPPLASVKFESGDEWKAIDLGSLYVKEGSALDQSGIKTISGMSNVGLSGRMPRLTIGPTGGIVAEGSPGTNLRLHGTGTNTPWIFGRATKDPDWKSKWDIEADTARRQGYNLIRLWTDSIYQEDMNIAADHLDKFDYFVSAFAKRGIYTFLTVGSYGLYLRDPWTPPKNGERRDYCIRMFLGDEQIRRAWKYGVETLMSHVNAYSGIAWKDDTSIACIELFNEQEMGYYHAKSGFAPQTRLELDTKYRDWLKIKYKTADALMKAWGRKNIASFEDATAPESLPAGGSQSDNDYILFFTDLSKQNAEWMRNTLRAAGYGGMVAQYNISHWFGGQEARWEESQVSIANCYFSHPTKFDEPGSKCEQDSSISTGAGPGYWRGSASTRLSGRPFIQTEFNHAFWNPYQHEGGLLFGAYSALQGFDGLMIHGDPVFSYASPPGLAAFAVGISPVARANEFLLACLYLRGDVRKSEHRVEIQVPEEWMKTDCNGGRSVSEAQEKLALITGLSISFPWAKCAEGVGKSPEADLVMPPFGGSEFKTSGGGWALNASSTGVQDTKFSLDATIAGMKEKGIIPKYNISDPAKGVFQSDTGEITMRTRENMLKVATSRSEAVSLEKNKGEHVGLLDVVSTSVPALVAACAVDNEPLSDSKRIVLIYSTCAVNSGMELSGDRTTLIKRGKLPVLIRTGKLEATLKNSNASKMSFYALGIDGSRREKLPLEFKDGIMGLSVDTLSLKDGPATFFELVEEK